MLFQGFTAALFSLPFDLIKSRLMAQKPDYETGKFPYNGVIDCSVKIFKAEGIPGFFRGFTAYYGRCVSRIAVQRFLLMLASIDLNRWPLFLLVLIHLFCTGSTRDDHFAFDWVHYTSVQKDVRCLNLNSSHHATDLLRRSIGEFKGFARIVCSHQRYTSYRWRYFDFGILNSRTAI